MEIDDALESSNHEEEIENSHSNSQNLGQNSRRAYLRELRKVIEKADVVLLVLDARDPFGTRSSAIEDMVLSDYRKKLVYVLNKADLVPKDILAGWLSYLRKMHPTIPFKCNTQSQKENLGRATGKVSHQNESALQTSQAIGAEELIGLLKNYSRIGDSKSIITVGIVGFPNVGKSSLINSLLRSRAVGVSSMPGFTKQHQEVILDKNIRLLDCPGVVFADGDSTATALRNCVNVEEMEDVITPIQAVLEKCPQQYLMQLYTIPKFKPHDVIGFLSLVAKITGRLKKGGIPNTDSAARSVLHDWNNGKIKYYCKPPSLEHQGQNHSNDKILTSFSNEFDIDNLQEEDLIVLNAIEAEKGRSSSYIAIDDVGDKIDFHVGEYEDDGSNSKKSKKESLLSKKTLQSRMDVDADIDIDEDKKMETKSTISGRSRAISMKSNKVDSLTLDTSNTRDIPIGQDIRKLQKKMKKKVSKDIRRGQEDTGDSILQEDYDFNEDYQY